MPFFELEVFQILIVKDKSMNEIGILDNAYGIDVTRAVNEVWSASFSMPIDDPKNELCTHFNYVEIISDSNRNYGMYRIMPTETKKSGNSITYKCEHVIATLMDDVIEGYLPALINQTTRVNLQRLLNLQTTKHWVLGQVDFERLFQYAFENENGLLAPILSIPQPFDEPYEFTYDTTVYPWKLNLLRSSDEVKAEIRWGKDMVDFNEVSDPTEIVNYIIPKGAGEGVNQLTIESVNNGLRYLKDDESIAKWGKKPYIWIDKRFTNPDSLKANAQSLLKQWKDPKISFKCPAVDLSILPEYAQERKVLNGVTRIIVEEKEYYGRIIKEKLNLDKEHEPEYDIANKLDDIATVQADVERKQQVNEAYSQGATNLDSYTFNDNCDTNFPAIVEFPFPSDMVYVNESKLRIKTSKFRTHVKGMEGGGAYVRGSTIESKSTANGGGATSGPSSRTTSASDGDHVHKMFTTIGFDSNPEPNSLVIAGANTSQGGQVFYLPSGTPAQMEFYTQGASGSHTHNMDHTHQIPAHTHEFSVTIPAINIPNHIHDMEYGIYEYNNLPTQLTVKVDGQVIPFDNLEGEIDITEYLRKDSNGRVTRDYHTIEVSPNDLARISMIVTNRFFIQSHIGGTY